MLLFIIISTCNHSVLFSVFEQCEVLGNVEARHCVQWPQPGVTLVSAAPGVEVLVLHQLVPEHEARVEVRVDKQEYHKQKISFDF